MTFPTVFANLAAGNQPAALLDVMFNTVGAMGVIPCTATGTNTITVTPLTNYYLPPAYANFQIVSFTAAATATGAVTIRIGALAFVKLFTASGLQAGAGDVVLNNFYIAAFNSALDTGNGGFQIFNATTPSVIQPVAGGFKNLVVTNGGTPDTQVAVTADEIMLENVSGGTAKVSTVSLTISTGASGANGLDTGAMANATFYAVWVIYNGSVTAGLISLSSTAPTLPSGYTYRARVGWVRTGAASTNLHRITQKGRRAQYVVTAASQTLLLPVMASGAVGTYSTTAPVWSPVSVASFVPSTASEIFIIPSTIYNNLAASNIYIAPNNAYTGAITTNPPTYSNVAVSGTETSCDVVHLMLEATTFQWVSGGAGGAVQCLGWIDNLN